MTVDLRITVYRYTIEVSTYKDQDKNLYYLSFWDDHERKLLYSFKMSPLLYSIASILYKKMEQDQI
jgi:hypothetical protein